MLDLQVVSDRIDDHVALDEPGDERRVPVRIAEVHPVPAPMIVTPRITQFQAGHLVEMPTVCWLLP